MDSHHNPSRVPVSGTINWGDINYPAFYKVVHFNLDELQGTVKRFVIKLYLGFLLIFFVLLLNLLSTILQAAKGYTPGINVFYSILNLFVLLIPAGHTAYMGYVGVCRKFEGVDLVARYRIYQAILCVFWFVFSIVPSGSFDGWMRIPLLLSEHTAAASFCVFLTVLQSLGFTVAFVLGFMCIFQISSVADEPDAPKFPLPRP